MSKFRMKIAGLVILALVTVIVAKVFGPAEDIKPAVAVEPIVAIEKKPLIAEFTTDEELTSQAYQQFQELYSVTDEDRSVQYQAAIPKVKRSKVLRNRIPRRYRISKQHSMPPFDVAVEKAPTSN